MSQKLLKKLGTGLALAGIAVASGCSGKLYFPAAKYNGVEMVVNEDGNREILENSNMGYLLKENARIQKLVTPHNDGAPGFLPLFFYAWGSGR